jgi:hypothetical protein
VEGALEKREKKRQYAGLTPFLENFAGKNYRSSASVEYVFAMPVVFEKDGFKFGFYSNDHRPIHVHVRKAGAEAIFDIEDGVELRESHGFKVRDLARAEEPAEEN